jgi:hypothetical protein
MLLVLLNANSLAFALDLALALGAALGAFEDRGRGSGLKPG